MSASFDDAVRARAAMIFEEPRDVFFFGPPPYAIGMELRDPASNRTAILMVCRAFGDRWPALATEIAGQLRKNREAAPVAEAFAVIRGTLAQVEAMAGQLQEQLVGVAE